MPSQLFGDDFSSYSPGYSGTYNAGIFPNGFSGPVIDFGTMTGSSSATGFYERLGHGLNLGLSQLVYQSPGTPLSSIQVVFAGMFGQSFADRGPITWCDNANLTVPGSSGFGSYTPLCGMTINNDFTISLADSSDYNSISNLGTTIVTSTNQVIFPNVWHIIQTDYTFGPVFVTVGTIVNTYIGFSGTFAVDGTVVLAGTGTTNVLTSSIWTSSAQTNQLRIVGGGYLGEMYGYQGQVIPYFPESVLPHVNLRYTQSLVEYAGNISEPNFRMTQGATEYAAGPSTRNFRMTQGVVEVILRRTPGGWILYEA